MAKRSPKSTGTDALAVLTAAAGKTPNQQPPKRARFRQPLSIQTMLKRSKIGLMVIGKKSQVSP